MRGSLPAIIGRPGWLLALVLALSVVTSAHADPFFVRVYGRTYKIDPRLPPGEAGGPKPQEIMKALPADLGRGPGFRPPHQEVLAEVEERTWIARNLLDRASGQTSRAARSTDRETTGSLPRRTGQARSPQVQEAYDRHRALDLLARELRRSLDLPVRTPATGFSRPKLSPGIEADYRALKFDPYEAYYGFRRVKAAFRSGDIDILAGVTHFPLTVTGRVRRKIHDRAQLAAMKDRLLAPGIREVVARSTFEALFVRDKGMMVGEGEVWITRGPTGFGLGAVNLE